MRRAGAALAGAATVRAALAGAAIVAALLVAARPAGGQTRFAPAVGGGSFNDAPLLEPGSYRDTILPAEELFYAVRLGEGQVLRVRAAVDADRDTFRESLTLLRVDVVGPQREPAFFAGAKDPDITAPGDTVDLTGPAAERSTNDADYFGPGTWYVAFRAAFARAEEPPRLEIPFTFTIERSGGSEPAATPAATPTPASTAAPASPRSDDGPSAAAAAAIGVAGAVAGFLAGLLGGAQRRRS